MTRVPWNLYYCAFLARCYAYTMACLFRSVNVWVLMLVILIEPHNQGVSTKAVSLFILEEFYSSQICSAFECQS